MQARRSGELQEFLSGNHGIRQPDQTALMHDYDVEEGNFELGDFTEDDDEGLKRSSADERGMHGRLSGAGRGRVQKENVMPKRQSSLR